MGPAVLFYTPDSAPDLPAHEQALAEHGYRLCHCPDTAALRLSLRRELELASHTRDPVLAVLAASAPLNRSAASILAATPQVGVLACIDACDDATLATTLQLGVDIWCPRTSSPQILALSLHSLKRRLERCEPTSGAPKGVPCDSDTEAGFWALKDQGWVLETPAGRLVRLTSAERQFVLGLVQQANQAASHAELLQALGRHQPDSAAARSTLGVLVSRLRRKVAGHGAELPVRSIHNRGYMFTAGIRL
ncbi:winged helix-turn-helix domain-containing protein [Pusillimonas sp.]|uniref:winged helix-turn-helix domain-containing protein n=1 Tax=Pusillimonas sp. TaxID=3040095 RepID=UPI0037C8C643